MARPEPLVLDASYLLEALLPTTPAWQQDAFTLIDRLACRDAQACVPSLFFAEVASVLSRKTRSGQLEGGDVLDFLDQMESLPLQVEHELPGAAGLFRRAARWNCGVFDAIYLNTAVRLALPVATRDRGMSAAARVAGVALFEG